MEIQPTSCSTFWGSPRSKATYAVVRDRYLTDEELITVFAGMESLLNSRPLTYQRSDPRDSVLMTPNHFLHSQMGGQFAP